MTQPRNELGEPATKTPEETIARLTEKVSRNLGAANRERIRAQIAKGTIRAHHDRTVMQAHARRD